MISSHTEIVLTVEFTLLPYLTPSAAPWRVGIVLRCATVTLRTKYSGLLRDLPIWNRHKPVFLLILTLFSGARCRYFSAAAENFAVVAT
jgi:hypothetical protein